MFAFFANICYTAYSSIYSIALWLPLHFLLIQKLAPMRWFHISSSDGFSCWLDEILIFPIHSSDLTQKKQLERILFSSEDLLFIVFISQNIFHIFQFRYYRTSHSIK